MADNTIINPTGPLIEYQYTHIKFIGDNQTFLGPYMFGSKAVDLTGNNDTLNLARTGADTITVHGHNDSIRMGLTTDMTIIDHSQGLTLNMSFEPNINVTLEDFQHNKTGKITLSTLPNQTVGYSSDQHGGTIISLPGVGGINYGSIDVKGYSDAADLAKHVVVRLA
jgi:hypothetical protein